MSLTIRKGKLLFLLHTFRQPIPWRSPSACQFQFEGPRVSINTIDSSPVSFPLHQLPSLANSSPDLLHTIQSSLLLQNFSPKSISTMSSRYSTPDYTLFGSEPSLPVSNNCSFDLICCWFVPSFLKPNYVQNGIRYYPDRDMWSPVWEPQPAANDMVVDPPVAEDTKPVSRSSSFYYLWGFHYRS
jgi:hypothetical protein